MDAMGYDIVEQRGSVEYENLGKSEMGLMKPSTVYTRDGGIGGPGGIEGRASAYVAGHGRGGSGVYAAGGGSAPHFGPLGTAIRNSGEITQEEGLSARDMEYESGASGRKQHGRRGK